MSITIQVASKQTLDETLAIVENESYGLPALMQSVEDTTLDDTNSTDLSPITDVLDLFIENLTGKHISENEFIEMVKCGMRPRVGTIVVLNNTETSTNLWVVADRDHDGVCGTVDLIPLFSGITTKAFDDSNSPYPTSDIRTWLITTFKSGFSTDIQNVLKPMEVYTNTSTGTTTSDKVKLLSAFEVQLATPETEGLNGEGTPYYELFSGNKSRIRFTPTDETNVPRAWWLRTPSSTDTNSCIVNTDGTLSNIDSSNSDSVLVLPCIRI